jgi:5-methylcytosine-specific restriction endonuclease McrA
MMQVDILSNSNIKKKGYWDSEGRKKLREEREKTRMQLDEFHRWLNLTELPPRQETQEEYFSRIKRLRRKELSNAKKKLIAFTINPPRQNCLPRIMSFEAYNKEFNKQLKEKIKQRDKYTCQECSITQEELKLKKKAGLHIHHIDYNKKNCRPINLISLCYRCHHRTYSRHRREYWKQYFTEKMQTRKLTF